MSRLSKIFAFFGIVAIGLFYATGIGHGQDYETTMDWKDIYILPTNPNPQKQHKDYSLGGKTTPKARR